jgi:hypothetical protein
MQEWKKLCYEWKIKFIINRKTESASKIRNPQKQYASFKTKRNYSMQKQNPRLGAQKPHLKLLQHLQQQVQACFSNIPFCVPKCPHD